MKPVLIIQGHPWAGSLGDALVAAYAEGVRAAGAEVRTVCVRDLRFDPVLRADATLEPDLLTAQRDILWAGHLAVFFPTWWGNTPALLKGFIDRVFQPGFAFRYREGSALPVQLLKGRSGRVVTTMDAPPLFDTLFYRSAGLGTVRDAVLAFCGVSPVRATKFGPVRQSTPARRQAWLARVRQLGQRDAA